MTLLLIQETISFVISNKQINYRQQITPSKPSFPDMYAWEEHMCYSNKDDKYLQHNESDIFATPVTWQKTSWL